MSEEKTVESIESAISRAHRSGSGRCMVSLATLKAARVNDRMLTAARQKYLHLGVEIESLQMPSERDNLTHTHSKLGLFLEDAFGRERWRRADR